METFSKIIATFKHIVRNYCLITVTVNWIVLLFHSIRMVDPIIIIIASFVALMRFYIDQRVQERSLDLKSFENDG